MEEALVVGVTVVLKKDTVVVKMPRMVIKTVLCLHCMLSLIQSPTIRASVAKKVSNLA